MYIISIDDGKTLILKEKKNEELKMVLEKKRALYGMPLLLER